ncbi:hypothetical protein FQA39_LY00174 [Lamprigera yunnana]|nr:hypothetical protein FQA39_LY00174 [Lamprigera yunnana]
MKMNTCQTILCAVVAILATTSARPQVPLTEVPKPYDFQYKVDNPQTGTYFGQNESGDQIGRVLGSYYVLLPDGRLMTVEYYVDGQSGYIPRISYQQNGAPVQG